MSAEETFVDQSVDDKASIGKSPESIARRWKMELRLADKREKKWRDTVQEILKTYAPDTARTNSFNILWTNTETLRQACYNSLPQPIVKRRYDDSDPIGKAISTLLTRSLEFSQESYDEDATIKMDVLDMLLGGRGVSRVRYVPSLAQIGGEEVEGQEDDAQESESYEELAWEQVVCEHVQWDDFRIGMGKDWDDVQWIAFRLTLKREDLKEKFGDIGGEIPLNDVDDDDINKDDQQELFKTAEVWEIWDKEEKQVVFICKNYARPCKIQNDPLGLEGFFPIARPLYAIEKTNTLVPTPLYSQYQEQAKELNRVSARINKIVDALKVRGIYDATLSEISQLTSAQENTLIPASNAIALLERGGIEKAIWMMPIAEAAGVLNELYQQREATKQVIYEISGISDILRSATNAAETYGAQKLKSQWGSQRLQRLQLEVQRYIRDLVRIKAEIIAEKFQPETLEQMTLMQLPHQAEIDAQYHQQIIQWQQQSRQLQLQPVHPGSPPPQAPPPPQYPQNVITWEKVISTMRDEASRTYRIDIETDSTLSASQQGDLAELQQLLGGIAQLVQGFGPAVQSGAIPIEAVKEIMLAVVRRAKMGSSVEDALDKMQPPQPPPDPHAGQMQIEQMKMQATAQLEQQKAQIETQQHQAEMQQNMQFKRMELELEERKHQREVEADIKKAYAEQQAQAEQANQQIQLDLQRDIREQEIKAQDADAERNSKRETEAAKLEMDRYKADLEYKKAIDVALINANARERESGKAED